MNQRTPPSLPEPQLVTRPRPAVIPDHGAVAMGSRHAPGFVGELCDAHAKFHLIIAGQAEWQWSGQSLRVVPGMLVFIAAGVAHQQRDLPDEPVTLSFIHLRPEVLPVPTYRSLAGQGGVVAIALSSQPVAIQQHIRGLFQQMLFEQDACRPGWEAVVMARVLDLAAFTIQLTARTAQATSLAAVWSNDEAGDSMARVAAYARQQESQFFRQQSLAEAAGTVHLGARRFTELFRVVTGETWNQRLLRLRLEHAERLLRDSDRSVTTIAFESGFDDLSHFNRSFKRRYASTPSAYRAHHCRIGQGGALDSPSPSRTG
jgi:AraC family L-rhamnose operon regulatory protein RhaS